MNKRKKILYTISGSFLLIATISFLIATAIPYDGKGLFGNIIFIVFLKIAVAMPSFILSLLFFMIALIFGEPSSDPIEKRNKRFVAFVVFGILAIIGTYIVKMGL